MVELLVASREAAGLSQGDLARLLGRPQSILSSLESGGRRVDVVELLEIAEFTNLDVHALIDELKAMPAEPQPGSAGGIRSIKSRAD